MTGKTYIILGIALGLVSIATDILVVSDIPKGVLTMTGIGIVCVSIVLPTLMHR